MKKKYRIEYDVPPADGRPRQQRRETIIGVTKHEAEAIRAKRVEAVKKGEYICDTDMAMAMAHLFEKFMATRRKRLAATSVDRYASLIATYVNPELGSVKVAALRKPHLIAAFEAWQDRDGRRPGWRTIKHAFDLLRAILNWAVRCDYASSNVAAKIAPEDLPRTRKPESTVLDETELRRLLETAKVRSRPNWRNFEGRLARSRGFIRRLRSRCIPEPGAARYSRCAGLRSTSMRGLRRFGSPWQNRNPA